MERKFVYVLNIYDFVQDRNFVSVYTDFVIAQKYMYRDIYNTITKYNIDKRVPVSNTKSKVEFDGFGWEIKKCDLIDRIDF